MRKVYLTERQLHLALESVTSNFGTDTTPGSIGSEVVTSPIIDSDDEEKEFANPVDTEKVAQQLYPQQWGTLNGRRY